MDKLAFQKLADEKLEERLGYPDEAGLIEILNRYEYQLHLEENSPLNTLGDAGQERRQQVSILRDRLWRRQGGETLDRFGVRQLSIIELEHLREETKNEIERLTREAPPPRAAPTSKPNMLLDALFVGLPEITFGDNPAFY